MKTAAATAVQNKAAGAPNTWRANGPWAAVMAGQAAQPRAVVLIVHPEASGARPACVLPTCCHTFRHLQAQTALPSEAELMP